MLPEKSKKKTGTCSIATPIVLGNCERKFFCKKILLLSGIKHSRTSLNRHSILQSHGGESGPVYLFTSCTFSFNFCLCLCLYLKLVDPIENRCKDDEVRAEATRELLKCIVDHRMAAKSLSTPERDAVSYLGSNYVVYCSNLVSAN